MEEERDVNRTKEIEEDIGKFRELSKKVIGKAPYVRCQ